MSFQHHHNPRRRFFVGCWVNCITTSAHKIRLTFCTYFRQCLDNILGNCYLIFQPDFGIIENNSWLRLIEGEIQCFEAKFIQILHLLMKVKIVFKSLHNISNCTYRQNAFLEHQTQWPVMGMEWKPYLFQKRKWKVLKIL